MAAAGKSPAAVSFCGETKHWCALAWPRPDSALVIDTFAFSPFFAKTRKDWGTGAMDLAALESRQPVL